MKLGHMFNIISGNSPNYLKAGVVMVHDHHSHRTRASVKSCVVPRIKSFGKFSFLYSAILKWNALPRKIQLCNTLISFKKNVKKYLWAKVASQSQSRSSFVGYFLVLEYFCSVLTSLFYCCNCSIWFCCSSVLYCLYCQDHIGNQYLYFNVSSQVICLYICFVRIVKCFAE